MATHLARKTVVLCLLLLCAALLASSASAVTIPVAPAGDGDLEYSRVTTNAAVLELHDYIYTAPFWPYYTTDDFRVGIIKIPISSLQGMNLTGASIKLNYYLLSGQVAIMYGGRFDGNGIVSLDDWNNFYGTLSGIEDIPDTAGPVWHSVDVAPYVQAQLARGYSWANFRLEIPHESTSFIAAAEDPQGRGAYLEVIPVPEPSSLMALMAGITGLGGMLIRRRK